MDIDRTFTERDEFTIESNQNKLFSVLNGLSHSVKEVGYIQGWNQIAGLYLLNPEFSEEMVYWIVNYLMHKVSLKDLYLSIQNGNSTIHSESDSEKYYTPNVQNSFGQQNQQQSSKNKYSSSKYNFDDKENDFFEFNKRESPQNSYSSIEDKQSSSSEWSDQASPYSLIKLDFLTYALKLYMKVYMNSVYRSIEKTNYVIYIQKWFTVLFSQQLSPELTTCFFAGIILQDWNYIIKMALAIFDLLKNEILSISDPDDIMELFYDKFDFTKEQVYNKIQQFEVTNEQLLQIMNLFDEQNDIENIQLIEGKFYKVEQKQRKEYCSQNSQGSSFFERVGTFLFSSTSKQESIQYFEERKDIKYYLPRGANIDENKFSEIIHFNRFKRQIRSPQLQNGSSGLSEQKYPATSIQSQINQQSIEARSNISRSQTAPVTSYNKKTINNIKATPIQSNVQSSINSKLFQQQHSRQLNYKSFLSLNQLSTKEKEYDITLQFQSN